MILNWERKPIKRHDWKPKLVPPIQFYTVVQSYGLINILMEILDILISWSTSDDDGNELNKFFFTVS